MKTTPTEWTMSSRDIVCDDRYISAAFKGGHVYNGALTGLRDWAQQNNVDVPLACHTPEGRHGLFPCIVAVTPCLKAALSALVGYPVALHDGVTFPSRSKMRSIAQAIHNAGIALPQDSLVWAVTDQAYADSKPAPKMLQHEDDCVPF